MRQAGPAKLAGNLKGPHSLSIPIPLDADCSTPALWRVASYLRSNSRPPGQTNLS